MEDAKSGPKVTSAADRMLDVMAIVLFIAVIVLTVVSVLPFTKSELVAGAIEFSLACLLAVVLLLRTGRLEGLKFGKEGIEATLAEVREATHEARETTKEVKEFMKATSVAVLGLIKRSGKASGGYSYDDKEQIKQDILANLSTMGIPPDEIEDLERKSRWHEYTAVDYVNAILWGRFFSPGSECPSGTVRGEAKKLLNRPMSDVATPDELEELFSRGGLLTKESHELIEDYRYYLEHHDQRRPEVWAKRGEWFKKIG